MIIALLLVGLTAFGVWAWWHQSRAVRMLRTRPSHVARPDVTAAAASPVPQAVPAPAPHSAARVTVRQLALTVPRPPTSVLGWEAFSIVSTLALEGTALIGCRRETADDWGAPDWRRDAGPSGSDPEIGTLVLLLGEDPRAIQAVALLDDWRAAETNLILRPTTVAGAIELFDGCNRALRACLLAG